MFCQNYITKQARMTVCKDISRNRVCLTHIPQANTPRKLTTMMIISQISIFPFATRFPIFSAAPYTFLTFKPRRRCRSFFQNNSPLQIPRPKPNDVLKYGYLEKLARNYLAAGNLCSHFSNFPSESFVLSCKQIYGPTKIQLSSHATPLCISVKKSS